MASHRLLLPLVLFSATLLAALTLSVLSVAAAAPSMTATSPAPSSPPSAADAPPEGRRCDAVDRSEEVNRLCVRSGDLTDACCRVITDAAARGGGLTCLCDIAFTPAMATSGYGAADLLDWYGQCGGTLRVDAHVLAKCAAAGTT